MRVYGLLSRAALAILVLTALPVEGSHAEASYRFETTPGKLPKTILPTAYRIDLRPDSRRASFAADEAIDLNVAQPTDVITLNAASLSFRSVTLADQPDVEADVSVDPAAETASFRFPRTLAIGRHTLHIAYSGRITAQPSGLYFNDYRTPGGIRRMLVTQFEAIGARRMFPGWDEPAFKATFRLSVVLPRDQAAVSNTPVAGVQPLGKDRHGVRIRKVTFMTTPSMSTYLVALAVADLKSVHESVAGVDIGAWAVDGRAVQARLAVRDAAELLPYFNEYFGVDYPLPKLDLIAVPGNFDGAMENWGAITYADNTLLFDAATSSESTRRAIYEIVAHEVAHQWTGDLVTMAWWDNLWLNEGFATWMETKATDHLKPEWRVWLQANADKERAMSLDALSTSHPIQSPVANDSDIDPLFDDIVYVKAAHVLRMIEAYIGADAFRRGVRSYLKKHAYSNATTADLWRELEAVSDRPVGRVAASFTEQPGLPLVHVTVACDGGRTQVGLAQERFAIDDLGADRLVWQIPVIAGTVDGRTPPQTVVLGAAPETLSLAGCGVPVKLNLGNVGYYRVAYDELALRALRAGFERLNAADRVSLLSDQWALVVAARAGAAAYFDFLGSLADETERVVWTQVFSVLSELDRLQLGVAGRSQYRAYARGVVRPLLTRLGWHAKAGEPQDDVLLRGEAIGMLGMLGDPDVLATSRQRFAEFLKNPSSLEPDVRDAVLTNTGRAADQATFSRLRALGRAATGTEERLRYYMALSCAQDARFVAQIVALSLSRDIAPARAMAPIDRAAACGADPDAVWSEALRHQEALLARVTAESRQSLLADVAALSTDPAVARELLEQPSATASSGARSETQRAIARIQARAALRARLLPQLHEWLQMTNDTVP